MNSPPSLDKVVQALDAMYRSNDAGGKANASIWLGELQKSMFAWQVSDQLLIMNRDVESCYFAAQTMRTKIQYSFHELPESSYQSLKESLLSHLLKITEDTTPAIVTQLCLAVADLSLQMVAWKNATQDFLHRFGVDEKHWLCLMELLRVLPEEINSRSLRLGANRRSEVTEELRANAPIFVQFLTTVLERRSSDLRLNLKLFKCLGSWFAVWALPQNALMGSNLLDVTFLVLSKTDCPPDLHEAASDCVCQALYATDIRDMNVDIAKELFQRVHHLLDPYNISVALEDFDKSLGYCRIFTELAETFLEAIVHSPNQGFGSLSTLELLLTCLGHHQYEIAEVTFNLWYRLSEEIYQLNMPPITEAFRPYIERLIVALYRHCQFDTDMEGVPSRGDDFVDFRMKVLELIKDIVFIIGSSNIFIKMFEQLQHNRENETSWENSEAALFVMMAVASNILPDDVSVVPKVFEFILHLPPSSHIMIRLTSVKLIGELNEWVEKHPNYIDPILQFLLGGLQNQYLADSSVQALVKLCEQCRSHMINHFSAMVKVVEAIDSFSVSPEAASELLRAAALILTKLPSAEITKGLKQLCNQQIVKINKILEDTQCKEKDRSGSSGDPSKYVDRLTALFRDTKPEVTNGGTHPFQPVIQEIWPVISHTCDQYQADLAVIERCCRCIRYLIRSLQKHSYMLLSPLVTQIVKLYSQHQHSCFLYLGSILVDEYGSEEQCHEGLMQMFQAFCVPAFKQLDEPNGLRQHPDTIDDFFRLSYRFLQRAPLLLLQSAIIKPLILCSIAAVSVDHRDANASVTKFLVHLVKLGVTAASSDTNLKDQPKEVIQIVRHLLEEYGEHLTQAILKSCVYHLPMYMMVDCVEIIHQMLLFDKELFSKWLQAAVSGLPTHTAGGVITATKEQMQTFHHSLISATEFKLMTRTMREFIKLYR